MAPESMHIPSRMHLEKRPTQSPRTDELPQLRDERGRTLAIVECWQPEAATIAVGPN